MARPERNNVDYFPFLCKEGKAMYYIEKTYGNDGYASWIRILRQLAVTNYHYLNLSDKVELMYLSSKCNVSSEVLIKIINDLCDLDEFDKELWTENSIIYSHKFIESIQDAYKKRNNKCLTFEGLLTLLSSLGIRKLSKSKTTVPVNPQSKVEYSIEEESKVDVNVNTFENSINLTHSNSLKTEALQWQETVAMQLKIAPAEIPKKLDEFTTFLSTTFKEHKNKKEFISHFINWLAKNLQNGKSKSITKNR